MPKKKFNTFMAEIKLFNNPTFGEVRTIIKNDGTLMFVASDVAKALGYSVPQKAVLDHCKHCSKMEHPTNKGTYINLIPESDLYRLTMKSKLPNAELFQDWVCEEVLPAIRNTGSYSVSEKTSISDKIKVAKFLSSFLNLNESSKLLIAKTIADPMGLPTPDYTPSKGILCSATDLLKKKGISISAQNFNQKAMEKGVLEDKTRPSSAGKQKHFKSITAKGLAYGENQVNPNNPKSTQPLWYEDKFEELLTLLEIK